MKYHNFTQELKTFSLKATPARLAVLKYLEKTDQPADVASIIEYLRAKDISADEATIFRIINIFTDKGLTRQLHLHEGKFRYELADRPEHHHLLCKHCGRIEDILHCGVEDLEKTIEKNTYFKIYTHSLEFFGICQNCQK